MNIPWRPGNPDAYSAGAACSCRLLTSADGAADRQVIRARVRSYRSGRVGQQVRDGGLGEPVADHAAVTFGGDRLGGAQVAQGLRDGGVVDPRRRGEVRDADG